MIEFLIFLLVVCAAGFIYLTFQSRWQVKDATVSEIELDNNSIKIKADKINLNGAVIVTGTISNAKKIDIPKADEVVNVVETANYTNSLRKVPPRINHAHWQIRTFERPRRKK